MNLQQFTDYWITSHTPLTAKAPGLRAYRCYAANDANAGDPPLDGVAICSFDSQEAWEAASASLEFQAANSDAPNFQDVEQTTSFYADEYIIV
jgi:uncharacterized protein (TIGR02118 family)